MESEEDCLLMTTEKKRGNLDYPSTLFLSFSKTNISTVTAVQNFEWGLDPRQTQVELRVDSRPAKTLEAYLQQNLMAVKTSEFLSRLEQDFKDGHKVDLFNRSGKKISSFSLIGFTKAYRSFEGCIKPVLATKNKVKQKPDPETKKAGYFANSSSGDALKFFLKAAVLFAIANGDIPAGSLIGSSGISDPPLDASDMFVKPYNDYRSSNQRRSSDTNSTFLLGEGGVTYRGVGNTIRSSDGESWRRVGNTIRSSSGVSYRQVGNTIRSSEGESWRRVGNTIRSSSGITWRPIGNTIRSSDGTTCRKVANSVRCR